MPFEQFFCLQQVIQNYFSFVRTLGLTTARSRIIPVVPIAMQVIESTNIEVCCPALGQPNTIAMQARRRKKDQHVEDHPDKNERADQV